MIPDAAHEVTHYLFKHPAVDFIWVTGGPKIVALANAAGKPGLSRRPRQRARSTSTAPRTCRGAVVDILISKTFDASVICPAEQTCIVDDAVYDEMVAEFERMGAHLLTAEEADAARGVRVRLRRRQGQHGRARPAGSRARRAAPGITVDPDHQAAARAAARPTSTELAAHPLVQEKLMPVLGLVRAPQRRARRSPPPSWSPSTAGWGTPRRSTPRTRPSIDAYAMAVRTGRILVNAPTAVGALGGVYNNLTPTFSLGCGTWGGSSTTENVNYLQLLNIKTVSHRRTPPQWFRVPGQHVLQRRRAGEPARHRVRDGGRRHRRRQRAPRGRRPAPRPSCAPATCRCSARSSRSRTRRRSARGVALLDRARPDLLVAVGGGSVIDAAKAMRLFYEHPEKTLDDLTLPFLDPRKRVADYPRDAHSVRLVAVPTTSGTGSEVSPAAVITVGEPQGDAGRLLPGARHGDRRPDADADACRRR